MKTISRKNNEQNKAEQTTRLRYTASLSEKELYKYLNTQEEGLTIEEAQERLERVGLNQVSQEKADSWLRQLVKAFLNPFNYILVVIAIISFVVDYLIVPPSEKDLSTVFVIVVMVLFSTALRFIQEYRSNRAAEQLKKMVKTTCLIKHANEQPKEVDITSIVPGDILLLAAGDMIPADCRVISGKDLFVSESLLTGESIPTEKTFAPIAENPKTSPLSLSNLCFMGTTVQSGTAKAVVINTGSQTFFGNISKEIVGQRPETTFDIGVNKVSYLLIRFMLVMVPIIFVINGLIKGDWIQALLFAIAVAVGLTPEMLPMIVTANLAKGAVSMSKKKVIVKRLNAIQNLGAMDILCTDKTGTLTLDKIVLQNHLNVKGIQDEEVLKWAYLNSFHQTGLKNLLDKAVLEHAEVLDVIKAADQYQKIDEIPFDFERRRMSVVLKNEEGKHLIICKGAVEEMLSVCNRCFEPGENRALHLDKDEIIQMDDKIRQNIEYLVKQLNSDGLRVLLVAIKEFDANHPLNYSVSDENNMVLTGMIGFLDPAKPSAAPSIEALHTLGINIKVITGDNEIITRKICGDVGIPIQNIVLGDELEQMDDATLEKEINDISVFAKVSPLQKLRIVRALRAKGHTVGFMGDGINDAAAIKESDVGISVDNAVDIAKESADIILLEKDLMVLKKGVIRGRRTFGNIVKYIKMTTSSNFGNMFSMLGASVLLPFLPMLPIQLLSQNMLYDISQSSIPWDKMDEEFLHKPKKWDANSISRFMLYIGPISSIFDYITFALMYFLFKANSPSHQALFQTGWFVEGLLSQTLIVHMIRTRKIPFIQSWATAPILALTSLIMFIGIMIPFTPFADILGMTALPLSYYPFLVLILLGYCLLIQRVKCWYIKRFNEWL